MDLAKIGQKDTPTFDELSQTLQKHIESGASIEDRAVISIIRKMEMTSRQRKRIYFLAIDGVRKQRDLQLYSEALKYVDIAVETLFPQ